jgi:hypothetical protein
MLEIAKSQMTKSPNHKTQMTKFQIGYKKLKKLDLSKMENQYQIEDPTIDYNPFKISGLQAYNPIYNRFFQMDETNYNMITLNNRCLVHDLKTVYAENEKLDRNIHIKFSPLLNPIHFLIGKYDLNKEVYKTLPKYDSDPSMCLPKNLDVNNSSYTDAFFSYLSSMLSENHGWIHGVEYYGSYLGIQNKFKIDIMDDFDFVNDSSYFLDNVGKRFEIDENTKMMLNGYQGSGSRNNRIKINILGESDNIDLEIDNVEVDALIIDEMPILVDEMPILVVDESEISLNEPMDDLSSDNSSSDNSSSDDSSSEGSSSSSDDSSLNEDNWETDSASSSSPSSNQEEQKLFCYLHDFPIQLIFQEKCKATFDSLLLHNIPDDELTSALFQVIMILITYQKAFDFTHNDLHTNNIMFIETVEPYLYYCFEHIYYKVPTFGRIFKLIDFGRAIYRFDGKLFCSDSFSPNNDAHSQYNCEPYMNENKPRIDPNPSFDLTRLGCSIYDFIFDDPKLSENLSEIHKIVRDWCLDDTGKSVVYKKAGQERYPGFKLYKMIARTVHKHIPKDQLKRPLFAAYSITANEEIKTAALNIDLFPKYIVSEKQSNV